MHNDGARTSRQPGHFQVSTVVRQVISCELYEGSKVKISVSQGASQGASQGRSFLARAVDLARPGVAPPLSMQVIMTSFSLLRTFWRYRKNSSIRLVYRRCRNDGISALKFKEIM